jgi:AraC-like DNA-binding protein
MSAHDSAQRQLVPRDRLVAIGLSRDDRDLIVRVARGHWALVFDSGPIPIHVLSQHEHDTVVITSVQWLESVDAFATHQGVFDAWHGVVLLPGSARPEQQRWLVRHCPFAQVVITGQPGTIAALSSALVAVRHHVVASALAARVGHVHSAFVTRVLLAALSLPPEQADVATLSRVVHMDQRTLHRKLTRAHRSCTPQRLLGWARLLHVAWYVGDRSRSVAQIAETLRWSAASNLHRLLKRYTALTTNELRAESAVDSVDWLITLVRAELELGED